MHGKKRLTDRPYSVSRTAALFSCALLLVSACDSGIEPGGDDGPQSLVLLEPVDRSETADAIQFSWSGGGSGWFRLQIATDSSFSVVVRDVNSGTVARHIVRELERGTVHYWRVRHEQSRSIGDWSDIRSFTPVRVAPLPGRPDLLAPDHLTLGLPREITVEWEPVVDAISYHLQVFMDEDLLLFHADLDELVTTEVPIRDLVFTYPYWWRVRAESVAGVGPWSRVWKFQVEDGE